jgi:hypothetical protein
MIDRLPVVFEKSKVVDPPLDIKLQLADPQVAMKSIPLIML